MSARQMLPRMRLPSPFGSRRGGSDFDDSLHSFTVHLTFRAQIDWQREGAGGEP